MLHLENSHAIAPVFSNTPKHATSLRPPPRKVSAELGLPYREGLVKNRYVGRTFIMPDQRMREMSVRRKLNAMPAVFEGKAVLLIDDSIVRGTTMTQIVDMVRRAGARKVSGREPCCGALRRPAALPLAPCKASPAHHCLPPRRARAALRSLPCPAPSPAPVPARLPPPPPPQVYLASSAPPVRFPNVYGVDMPNRKEFVAHNLTEAQVRAQAGAGRLAHAGCAARALQCVCCAAAPAGAGCGRNQRACAPTSMPGAGRCRVRSASLAHVATHSSTLPPLPLPLPPPPSHHPPSGV